MINLKSTFQPNSLSSAPCVLDNNEDEVSGPNILSNNRFNIKSFSEQRLS